MCALLLDNAPLLDPEACRPAIGALLVERGQIVETLGASGPRPKNARRVDLGGRALSPGFLDVHFHGELAFANPGDAHDALHRASASLVRHGVTGFLPTSLSWDPDRLRAFVDAVTHSMTQAGWPGAEPLGLHLEGPWIRPEAAGAQPAQALRPYDPREGADLLTRGQGVIRMLTLAPEVRGSAKAVACFLRAGVVIAAGHTLAREEDLDRAVTQGMTHVTHLFNAMGPVHHRDPGVAGHLLTDERVTCDLICDGAHVHPRMVRLAARALGERLLLISDRVELPASGALPASGEPPQAYEPFWAGGMRDDGIAWRRSDGRLAGSCLTLDRAVRNLQVFAGSSLLEAVAACTLRPARLLGIESERGSLRAGARADLAVLAPDGSVVETWIAGERVWTAAPPRAAPQDR